MRPNSNQQSKQQENSEKTEMRPPEAASKRDVEEAERKAEKAEEKARNEVESLREEIEELREEKEEMREVLASVDQLVHAVYQKAATRKGEPPLNQEMPHMHPDNRDDGGSEESQPGSTDVPIPDVGGESDV
jgi:septal ring factor EnvC (AmiA/AmiB activator)